MLTRGRRQVGWAGEARNRGQREEDQKTITLEREMERQRGKQAEPWKGWGICAVTCSDPAHPEHGESRCQAPAASLLSPSVIMLPSSACLGPRAAACWFFYSLREEWEGQGGGWEAAATRWDLGLRGDYQEGWSCVCAVPGSPGPFCHGLTPSRKALHTKPLTFPTAPARPWRDCHTAKPPLPQPRSSQESGLGTKHPQRRAAKITLCFSHEARDSPSLSPVLSLCPYSCHIKQLHASGAGNPLSSTAPELEETFGGCRD